MSASIASVGLATTQGSGAALASTTKLHAPAKLPWPPDRRTTTAVCRPAPQLDGLAGSRRWRALARYALSECLSSRQVTRHTPIIIASCNGAGSAIEAESWRYSFDASVLLRDTPWAGEKLPIVSSSCASGLQALFIARQLIAAGDEEVIVLAVDILSPANHDNFEALRLLAPLFTAPWQSQSRGFLLGEAAVALRLINADASPQYPLLAGPVLSSDLQTFDGLATAAGAFEDKLPDLILGAGTGPFDVDRSELAAIAASFDRDVAMTTPLVHFGHTLGASGLLGVALAAIMQKTGSPLPALSMPVPFAMDGRPLANGNALGDRVVIAGRALSGACACAGVGFDSPARVAPPSWREPEPAAPVFHPALRRISEEALRHRPGNPPDALVVRLEEPLSPPSRASIGGRLLPSAVAEITPGFTAQRIARCWGFAGPALCLVGGPETKTAASRMLGSCAKAGLRISQVVIRGGGNDRDIQWED